MTHQALHATCACTKTTLFSFWRRLLCLLNPAPGFENSCIFSELFSKSSWSAFSGLANAPSTAYCLLQQAQEPGRCQRGHHSSESTKTQCKVTCWFWPKCQMQAGKFVRSCHKDVQQTRPLTEQISSVTEQIFSSGANLLPIYNLCTNLCEAWRDLKSLCFTMGCRRISWWLSQNAINDLGSTFQKCTFNLGCWDWTEKIHECCCSLF